MNTELWGDGTGKDAARLLQRLRDGMTLAGELHHAGDGEPLRGGGQRSATDCNSFRCGRRRRGAGRLVSRCQRHLPDGDRVAAAQAFGVDVLPEEAAFPMILHQKLSAVLARGLFGERNDAVLSAIGCHTTLKVGASTLDTVVFVADKIAWDQPGIPPYRDALLGALAHSLDAAAFVYLHFLWERRATLGVIHPWFVAAYQQHANTGRCP